MKSKFESYFAALRGRTAAVCGIGVSNIPLIKLLIRSGAKIIACDRKKKEDLGAIVSEFESLGVEFRFGADYLTGLDADVIFRTPGLRPDAPELVAARERGAQITSEMEAFFETCPCKIIGVTGSDGKTTTTSIITELLREEGKTCYLGGNIGRPLLSDVDGMVESDYAVVELSSFQLMTMKKSPDIAVVTNITPNHLDVHTSMEEYVGAKENIFLYQSGGGRLVINYLNDLTRGFAEKARGEVIFFGDERIGQNGVYYSEGSVFCRDDGKNEEILEISDIAIPGMHNVENYMAAIAALRGIVSNDTVRKVAKVFHGVEHRIEYVRTVGGAAYYNDSIASSPTRTVAGLRSFDKKVILIAGGYDKNIPFDKLGEEIAARAELLLLMGTTAEKIKSCVLKAPGYKEGELPILMCGSLEEAVKTAHGLACESDVVLFSPACASFDMYPNFMVRGEEFKRIVRDELE